MMTQKDIKRAYKEKTPVYYVDDDGWYDFYPEKEADVIEGYIVGYDNKSAEITKDIEGKSVSVNRDIFHIFSTVEAAYKSSIRRFKGYIDNLRAKYKEMEKALKLGEKRLEILRDNNLIC